MVNALGELTKHELQEMIESIIEQKLIELLGDPDEGKQLRKVIRDRLARQQKEVAAGERGKSLSAVVEELGLD